MHSENSPGERHLLVSLLKIFKIQNSAPQNCGAFLTSDFSTVGKPYLDGSGSSLYIGPFVLKKDRIGIIWCDKYSLYHTSSFLFLFFSFSFASKATRQVSKLVHNYVALQKKKKITFY